MYLIIIIIVLFVLTLLFLGNTADKQESQSSKDSLYAGYKDIEDGYLKELSKSIKLELSTNPNYESIFRNKPNNKKLKSQHRIPIHRNQINMAVFSFSKHLNRDEPRKHQTTENHVREIWNSSEMGHERTKKILQILLPSLENDLLGKFSDAITSTDNGNYLDAIDIYNSLILQSKQDIPLAIFYNNRGCLKIHCNSKHDFINDFTKAIKHNKKALYSFNLGCAYTHIDEWEKSISNLRKFDSLFSKEIIEAIESMHTKKLAVLSEKQSSTHTQSGQIKSPIKEPKERQINHVYLGIPQHLFHKIIWVEQKYRTNSLSRSPGGTNVVVEFHNQDVFGYDRIKRPSAYIEKFCNEYTTIDIEYDTLSEQLKIDFFKQYIHRIFAQKNDPQMIAYQEVWNYQTASKFPWAALTEFDIYPE